MNKILKVFLIVLAVLIGLHLLKDQVIKAGISTVGSSIVGAPIHVGHFSLNFLTQKVRIGDLKVYNPPGYPDEPLINIPQIAVDFDTPAFFKGKLHFPLIVLNMKEMVLVRNKEGVLNVDSLKVVEQAKEKKDEQPKKSSKELAIQIDDLKLNVDRVILKDFSSGRSEPSILVYEIGMKNKEFKNIKSIQQLSVVVMSQAMGPTAIKSAGMYAAATLVGVGFLPAGVAGVLFSKSDSIEEFSQSVDKLYEISLQILRSIGEINSEDRSTGVIKANVEGCDVLVEISKSQTARSQVRVAVRKMMLPKPEIAGGILYRIEQKLK